MEDEKKCRVGGMYEAIILRGEAPDYSVTSTKDREGTLFGSLRPKSKKQGGRHVCPSG